MALKPCIFILLHIDQVMLALAGSLYGSGQQIPPLKNYNVKGTESATHVKRILAFGDSITEGYTKANGPLQFFPYTTRLEELLNAHATGTRFEVINEGVSGECVYMEMATRLPHVLKQYAKNLAVVIILGGTNDLRTLDCEKNVNVAYELHNLHNMVHKHGIKTVAVTIPEAEENDASIEKYDFDKYELIWNTTNNKIRQYALTHRDTTLLCDLAKEFPMKKLSEANRQKHWSDNLHPTKLGYKKVARLFFNILQKDFGLLSTPIGRTNVHEDHTSQKQVSSN